MSVTSGECLPTSLTKELDKLIQSLKPVSPFKWEFTFSFYTSDNIYLSFKSLRIILKNGHLLNQSVCPELVISSVLNKRLSRM